MEFESFTKSLPEDLAREIVGYTWRQIHLGLSPSKVFRLEAENNPCRYLKISSRIAGFSLLKESNILDWLKNRLPVPETLAFGEDENTDYLLLSAIEGIPASDDRLKADVSQIIEQLASGLKIIHGLPIENCPFDERLDNKIKIARERISKGLIDETDFDEKRLGRTVEDLFREAIAAKPDREDLVFTHGDYCVPNVILENGKLSGFVDWGSAGIADRHQDLALLTRSISYNFGKEWEEKAFEIYGIEPDWKKINFYRLLDEFF